MLLAATQRRSFALWALMLLLTTSVSDVEGRSNSLPGRRALLAQGSAGGASAACSTGSSRQLLTNGYFNKDNLGDMHNQLLMMTMANDVYPWAKQYDMHLLDVADGLNEQQVTRFQQLFGEKYTSLGATNIQFLDYYEQGGMSGAAAHAAVLGTSKEVFVVIRGTADLGQVQITGQFETRPLTVYGSPLQVYYPVYASFTGLWVKLLPAVKRAIAATDSPSSASVYLTGHSLGAASACLAALVLQEQGYKIGGVWAFDPFKAGTTCSPNEECWVSVYDRHLADVTYAWWNNQDPIPQLVDEYFKSPMNASAWGHVPSNGKHWFRIVGDRCLPAEGTDLMQECPPAVDAADGKADGICPSVFGDHLPWNILRRIANCALLQNQVQPPPANARVAAVPKEALRVDILACTRSSVWRDLLGLGPPPGKR